MGYITVIYQNKIIMEMKGHKVIKRENDNWVVYNAKEEIIAIIDLDCDVDLSADNEIL